MRIGLLLRRPEEEEKKALAIKTVETDSKTSQRAIAKETGISQSLVNENRFYPYHVTLAQDLKKTDYFQRLELCRFSQNKANVSNDWVNYVMFSD